MKKILKYSWLIGLIWFNVHAQIVESEFVPGGVVEFNLNIKSDTPPIVIYNGHRAVVIRAQDTWHTVLGIPLSAKIGTHTFEVNGKSYPFEVTEKRYFTQRLKLNNKRQVNPNAEDIQRITEEKQQITAALSQPWTASVGEMILPLSKPTQGGIEKDNFGARRVFNGQPRQPHTGLDVTVALGTPVLAAADGIVVNVGDYFFNGNTVFLSHGQGVVTMYCHLNDFAVKQGQQVRRGDLLGTVGMTGRATGPHLHWGVWLNHTWINPQLVTQ